MERQFSTYWNSMIELYHQVLFFLHLSIVVYSQGFDFLCLIIFQLEIWRKT